MSSRPLNVLQLISSGLGYYGAERVVVTLANALEELNTHNIVAAFFNTAKESHLEVLEHANQHGLQTEQITCNGRLDRRAVKSIRDIVARHNIDIIHCHGIKPDLYAILAQCPDVALVSTCHLWVFDSAKAWAVAALERCLLHAVDRVVVVSEQILPQLHRFGVKADVIHNGIDLEPFRRTQSDLRQTMKWCDRPVIGAIGRLAPQKGLQYLLQAAPLVLRDEPNALFVFVGDGPERGALEAEAGKLGIRDAVCFLGVREDIPELLSAMDIVAMPSLSEGLPMALLEAMASGKPVVATRVGAIPQVIQERVSGIMLSPGDVSGLAAELRGLLKSSELRRTLGENARKTIEDRFSSASMAKQYLGVYREALAAKGA
jgi:glycosyltransferase involved in cell wall biosynthesis